nr:TolC family outer membrane protein [Comamonas composti]
MPRSFPPSAVPAALPHVRGSHALHWLACLGLGSLLSLAQAAPDPTPVTHTLSELVARARGFDAQWQAQQADARATASRAEQARAGLLPSVGLQAGVSEQHSKTNIAPGTTSQPLRNFQLSAQQPLYRPANKIAYEQGQRSLDAAQAQLAGGEQTLLVRVAQAYFDVLGAQDSLAVVRAQKQAIAEQLASAQRNFELGTATITDAREAQARFDLSLAQEIAASNELEVKRLALEQIVGSAGVRPRPLAAPLTLAPLAPADAQSWVDLALAHQPQLHQAQVALDIARMETRKAEAGHKPTVDLQAGAGMNRYPEGSITPPVPVPYTGRAASVGVVMNLPLFAGFAVQNRIQETLALEDKARAQLDEARRSVEQNTRTAFLGVQSGQAQVTALEAALASSQSALEANQRGYQVGVRINIDVLNAQSQLYQTRRDLALARYALLMGQLRLRQATGQLSDADLSAIDALTEQRIAQGPDSSNKRSGSSFLNK